MGTEKEKSSPVAELTRGRQTRDEKAFLLLGCVTGSIHHYFPEQLEGLSE